jgi:hypothetical protein
VRPRMTAFGERATIVVPDTVTPSSVRVLMIPFGCKTFRVVMEPVAISPVTMFAVVAVNVVMETVVSVTAVATRVAIVAVPATPSDVNLVAMIQRG